MAKPYAEFGSILRNLRLLQGRTQQELSEHLAISNSYLSRMESGERLPSPKLLRNLSSALNHSYDDLIIKSGLIPGDFAVIPQHDHDSTNGKPDETTAALQKLINKLERERTLDSVPTAYSRSLPVYDTVPAGLFKDSGTVDAFDEVEHIFLPERELNGDPRAFALRVSGDSMEDAGILDGDVVVVSPATRVESGDVGVVRINGGETTLKRVYFEQDERVILQSANSRYAPRTLAYPTEVEILGKVILVHRKL